MVVDFGKTKERDTVAWSEVEELVSVGSGGVTSTRVLCLKVGEGGEEGEEEEEGGNEEGKRLGERRVAEAVLLNAKAGVRGVGRKAGVSPMFFNTLG